jgi:threonine/homoserine/homoserine lactone efflux protein
MALTAAPRYAPRAERSSVLMVAGVFGAVNLPCVSLWAAAGSALGRWLGDPRHLRVFNIAMAVLLLATLWPVLAG